MKFHTEIRTFRIKPQSPELWGSNRTCHPTKLQYNVKFIIYNMTYTYVKALKWCSYLRLSLCHWKTMSLPLVTAPWCLLMLQPSTAERPRNHKFSFLFVHSFYLFGRSALNVNISHFYTATRTIVLFPEPKPGLILSLVYLGIFACSLRVHVGFLRFPSNSQKHACR